MKRNHHLEMGLPRFFFTPIFVEFIFGPLLITLWYQFTYFIDLKFTAEEIENDS